MFALLIDFAHLLHCAFKVYCICTFMILEHFIFLSYGTFSENARFVLYDPFFINLKRKGDMMKEDKKDRKECGLRDEELKGVAGGECCCETSGALAAKTGATVVEEELAEEALDSLSGGAAFNDEAILEGRRVQKSVSGSNNDEAV